MKRAIAPIRIVDVFGMDNLPTRYDACDGSGASLRGAGQQQH
jgi:hypothetical protein